MPDTWETVFLLLTFIVPGFVFYEVLSWKIPQQDQSDQKLVLKYLGASFLNYAAWIWLIYLIGSSEMFIEHPIRTAFALLVVVFLSPSLAAFAVGSARKNQRVQQWLRSRGFLVINPIPTAWAAKFSEVNQALLLVTLDEGGTFGGLFAGASHASSDPEKQDLYLEHVYSLDEGNQWHPVPRDRGMWIRADAIRSINFLGNEEETNGE